MTDHEDFSGLRRSIDHLRRIRLGERHRLLDEDVLPAASARRATSAWVTAGVAMTTASTSSAAKTSSSRAVTFAPRAVCAMNFCAPSEGSAAQVT